MKELFSVPNLMGYFRILLIPVFSAIYLNAESQADYYLAALIVGISSVTDLLDGWVARKFHMVTEFGKLLDPVADKLTHGALLLCLCARYSQMILLVLLFIVKEGFMVIMGLVKLRKGKKLDGAQWFGKICTAVLFAVLFLLLAFPQIPAAAANTLITVCGLIMTASLCLYIPVFRRM